MENKEKSGVVIKKTFYSVVLKRFFDVILSLLAIIILSPVFIILSVVLLCVLRENVIFAQYRPGKNGKVFKLYKFKTMRTKYKKDGTIEEDSKRITNFGKFLRKVCLDELPQLFNILKGDMSFVGPRPRLVKDMIFYNKETLATYSVRPGLTGLAQISGGRSDKSWEDIFANDTKYVQKITFWGDVWILIRTVFVVLKFNSDSGYNGESKRDYYYSDYLLKSGKIDKKQYKLGLEKAEEVIKNSGEVHYQKELHNINSSSDANDKTV